MWCNHKADLPKWRYLYVTVLQLEDSRIKLLGSNLLSFAALLYLACAHCYPCSCSNESWELSQNRIRKGDNKMSCLLTDESLLATSSIEKDQVEHTKRRKSYRFLKACGMNLELGLLLFPNHNKIVTSLLSPTKCWRRIGLFRKLRQTD